MPGHEQGERQVLARVERQRLDLLPGDDAGDLRLGGVDDRRLAVDGDRLGQRLQLHHEVLPEAKADGDHDVGYLLRRKAAQLGLDRVAAGRKRLERRNARRPRW